MFAVILYHTLFYVSQSEFYPKKLMSVVNYFTMIALFLIVNCWMAYFIDKHKKLNYCIRYQLSKVFFNSLVNIIQQKENLLDILDFLPECLLIAKKEEGGTDGNIFYQNDKMKKFQTIAQNIVWNEEQNSYVRVREEMVPFEIKE